MTQVGRSGGSPLATVGKCNGQFQPVFPFQQLLTILPSNTGLGNNTKSPSTGTPGKLCKQDLRKYLPSQQDNDTHQLGSPRQGHYSVPRSAYSRPKFITSPHSAVIDVLKADEEGKDASYAISQLLEETIDLANAFARGEITTDQFTNTTSDSKTIYEFQNDVTSPGKKKREPSNATSKRRNVTQYSSF